MKNQFFGVLILLLSISLSAQYQIRVEYEIQPNYDFSAAKEKMDIIAKKAYYELLADRDESQYNFMERVENEQPDDVSEETIIVEIGSPGIFYVNTKDAFFMKETNLANKPVIIKDSLEFIDWKIEKATKEVEGIQTRKAVANLKNNEITAWYAPKMPYKSGPDKYWGLPGIILELQTVRGLQNGGTVTTVYKAIKVEIPKKDREIKRPAKGKEVTSTEFSKAQKEFQEKQREMYGGGVDKD